MDKEQIKQIIGENQEFVKDITFMERPFTFEDALSSSGSFSTLIGSVLQLVLPNLQPDQG